MAGRMLSGHKWRDMGLSTPAQAPPTDRHTLIILLYDAMKTIYSLMKPIYTSVH